MKCKWCDKELTSEDIKDSPRPVSPAKPVEPDECIRCIVKIEQIEKRRDIEFDALESAQELDELETEARERDNLPWVPDHEPY